jgi:hypothetical protein
MSALIKIDLKNCLSSEKFKLCFLFLLSISLLSFIGAGLESFMANSLQLDFSYKMGIMQGSSGRSALNFILLIVPLIVCVMYSDSFIYEKDMNIYVYFFLRASKLKYFLSKIITIFIVVFFTLISTLSINEILTVIAIPNIGANNGYGIPAYLLKANASRLFLENIYYSHLYLYNFLLILITAFYGALIAVIGFNLSLILKLRKVTLFIYMFLGVHLTLLVLPSRFQIYEYIQASPGKLSDFIITLTGWIMICIVTGTIGIWKGTTT